MTYKLAIIFTLRARHHHLATGEDQSSCLGFANAHDDGSETLRVVLRIAGMKCDSLTQVDISVWLMLSHKSDVLRAYLQIKPAIKVDSGW